MYEGTPNMEEGLKSSPFLAPEKDLSSLESSAEYIAAKKTLDETLAHASPEQIASIVNIGSGESTEECIEDIEAYLGMENGSQVLTENGRAYLEAKLALRKLELAAE